MILSEYQAKREELERKMQELNTREAEHKMELSIKHQMKLKKIADQIGSLKHQRAEANKQYEMDKAWTHRKYKEEKQQITQAMHLLRMEYLTVNPDAVTSRDLRGRHNNTTASEEQHEQEGGEA